MTIKLPKPTTRRGQYMRLGRASQRLGQAISKEFGWIPNGVLDWLVRVMPVRKP